MKHSTSNSMRWSCRLVRGWRAFFGASHQSGFGSSHIASCPACQGFFAANDSLESALRRDAARGIQPAPAGIEERIMQEIVRSPRRRVTRLRPGPAALAIAGAAAAILAIAFWYFEPVHPPGSNPVAGNRPPVVAMPATAEESAANQPWAALTPSVAALLKQDPLQTEVDSVYADARSAVHFLALNFLPSAPVEPDRNGETSQDRRAAGG